MLFFASQFVHSKLAQHTCAVALVSINCTDWCAGNYVKRHSQNVVLHLISNVTLVFLCPADVWSMIVNRRLKLLAQSCWNDGNGGGAAQMMLQRWAGVWRVISAVTFLFRFVPFTSHFTFTNGKTRFNLAAAFYCSPLSLPLHRGHQQSTFFKARWSHSQNSKMFRWCFVSLYSTVAVVVTSSSLTAAEHLHPFLSESVELCVLLQMFLIKS